MSARKQRASLGSGQIQKPGIGQKQKPGQTVSQKTELAKAIRQTPLQHQATMASGGVFEPIADRPEHIPLDPSRQDRSGPLDQREWSEETDPSRKSNHTGTSPSEAHTFVQESLHAQENLSDYLLQNFAPDLDGVERKAFDAILEALDSRTGFLHSSVADINSAKKIPNTAIASTLKKLREVEPKGLGCESREHYRVFLLEQDGRATSNEYKILQAQIKHPGKHPADIPDLDDLMEQEDLDEAIKEINALDSFPWKGSPTRSPGHHGGVLDSPEQAPPEIRFVKIDGRWTARLLRDSLAQYKLTDYFERIVEKHAPQKKAARRAASGDATANVDASISRLKVLEKAPEIQADPALLNQIRSDSRRLLFWKGGITSKKLLADYIAEEQSAFFESGGDWTSLKPLAIRRVAEDLKMHRSTVSSHYRGCWVVVELVSGRELTLPLKALVYGSEGDTGAPPRPFQTSAAKEQASRELINRIIGAESSNHRVTDDILFTMLHGCGHNVTRQWVASRRAGLGHSAIRFAEDSQSGQTGILRFQAKPRDWTIAEAEAFLRRLALAPDRKRMENALRRVNATAQEYNPFAANALICEIARHEPLDRPLSAAHYAVMLNALGFPLSRKWVEAAMKGKRDGRHKKAEDVVEVRPVRRQRRRASSWSPRELSQLLSQAGHTVEEGRVEAAFDRIIEKERAASAERQRIKRAAEQQRPSFGRCFA